MSFEREALQRHEYDCVPEAQPSDTRRVYTMADCGLKIGDEIKVRDSIWVLVG